MPVSDIIVSPASIWMAPVGTTPPDIDAIAAGVAWGANWEDMGYTLEPVSVGMNVQTFDLFVQQLTTPVRTLRTQIDAMFKTTLAEFTGKNIQVATDGTLVTVAASATKVGSDTIDVKADKTDVSLYAFGIEGVRVTDSNERVPVRIIIPRGSARLSGDISFAKGAGVGIPIEIKALADENGIAFKVQNVTAPKTA